MCGNGDLCPELATLNVLILSVISIDVRICKLDEVNSRVSRIQSSLQGLAVPWLQLKCSRLLPRSDEQPLVQWRLEGNGLQYECPIPCSGQTQVTYDSICNLVSTDLFSSERCLSMYSSASPSVILNQHCGAGITTFLAASPMSVWMEYNDFLLKMEMAGASHLYGKPDNWLAWCSGVCFFYNPGEVNICPLSRWNWLWDY